MLPSERKRKILGILKDRREVSVQALADLLGVGAANVRRDLRELEAEKRIDRRHGRAIFRPTFAPTAVEEHETLEAALLDELVGETAWLLNEARNLFLTGGPALVRVAKKLQGKTIATHDLGVAMAAASSDNDVTLVGREIDNRTLTLRSPRFDQELQEFYFDAAVVEVDGVDEKNLWVARQNHAFLPVLLGRSDSFVAVAKSSVLGRKGDRVAGPLTRADLVVLDKGASEDSRRALRDAGVELRVAGDGALDAFGLDKVGNVFLFKRGSSRFGGPAEAATTGDAPGDPFE